MKRMTWNEIRGMGKQIIVERYRTDQGPYRVMETIKPNDTSVFDSQEFDCIEDFDVIVAFQAPS